MKTRVWYYSLFHYRIAKSPSYTCSSMFLGSRKVVNNDFCKSFNTTKIFLTRYMTGNFRSVTSYKNIGCNGVREY